MNQFICCRSRDPHNPLDIGYLQDQRQLVHAARVPCLAHFDTLPFFDISVLLISFHNEALVRRSQTVSWQATLRGAVPSCGEIFSSMRSPVSRILAVYIDLDGSFIFQYPCLHVVPTH